MTTHYYFSLRPASLSTDNEEAVVTTSKPIFAVSAIYELPLGHIGQTCLVLNSSGIIDAETKARAAIRMATPDVGSIYLSIRRINVNA
jgi:hypothetical protein